MDWRYFFKISLDLRKMMCFNKYARFERSISCQSIFDIYKRRKNHVYFYGKAENVERKWYVLDAAGKPLGRTAATAAMLLRGKHKTTFTPHVDCGDFVIIVNADKAVLTGKKLTQKYYRHHTGWVGGLKEVQYKTLMAEKPEFAMQLAVKGMLPKNSIGRQSATRLKVFAGENHNHQAQKPENWEK